MVDRLIIIHYYGAPSTEGSCSPLAQLVERRTVNPQVPRSSRGGGAKLSIEKYRLGNQAIRAPSLGLFYANLFLLNLADI